LSDGSLVWLNSETVLTYDAFDPRKVTIEGEGYFEVKKDRSNPFEVTTSSGMKVKVTGTSFNLRSIGSESYVETTLDEGEVIIEGAHSDQLAVLAPGQQATYNLRNHKMLVKNVQTEIFSLWKNNELRFADISFAQLIPRIERWYGVSIQLDQRINSKDRFTLTIKTESLRELLDMMKLTSKFNYEINGELVKIHAK
jgi:ferric-dicitrate binding protein FerR (iron transport regulator)